jgi:hypothetical protein
MTPPVRINPFEYEARPVRVVSVPAASPTSPPKWTG